MQSRGYIKKGQAPGSLSRSFSLFPAWREAGCQESRIPIATGTGIMCHRAHSWLTFSSGLQPGAGTYILPFYHSLTFTLSWRLRFDGSQDGPHAQEQLPIAHAKPSPPGTPVPARDWARWSLPIPVRGQPLQEATQPTFTRATGSPSPRTHNLE